jgi:RNA recognition motif-containing protein
MDIYVGNLSYEIEENAIRELFTRHGTVSGVKLLTDRETGRSRGIAFVTMDDFKEAKAAIKALDGEEVSGRPMKVNQAREREPQGGGHQGGGNFRRKAGGGGGNRGHGRY